MRILELWRYPVSSIGGERILAAQIGAGGVRKDRQFAIVDGETRQPAAPEKIPKWRKLLFLFARSEGLERPEIRFPDGLALAVDDSRIDPVLSDFLGFHASICKYAHPDLSHLDMPVAENRYSPAPLHVVSQSSLDRLSDMVGSPISARRFRPNVVLDGENRSDFEENGWTGRMMRIGQASCFVSEPTVRCGMTIVAQPDVAENADVLRSLLRFNKRNFGAYCDVRTDGCVAEGDAVLLE